MHQSVTKGCLGLILFSLLLAACSKEYNGKTEGISFLVKPLNTETGVDPSIVVRAVFNRDILSTSINSSSLTLSSPTGGVTGVVWFDGQYNRVNFMPGTELAYSTTYTAHLSNWIADVHGNYINGYSWSFTTRGGGWGSPFLIEYDDTGAAINPAIAMDSRGNGMAVWQQFDGVRDNLWASRYTAGKGWGAATLIESENLGNANNPKVALDSNGNALAVWSQFNGSVDNIWANHYTEGSGWGTAVKIETDDAGAALLPQIVFDNTGNAIAVWHQFSTVNSIWANRYTPGGGWGTAEKLETDDAGNANNPKVAFDSNGNAIAVWSQFETSAVAFNIWTNRYTAGSGWGVAEKIDTEDLGAADYPEIAFDQGGNAIAVWHQFDGLRNNIWANRYTVGVGWGSPAKIETDDTLGADYPQIAFGSNGNAVAVWFQSSGTDIVANRYLTGSGWGTAQVIDADTGSTGQAYPKIGFDKNGRAIVVWSQYGTSSYYVWSNRVSAGGVWSSAEKIGVNDVYSAYSPNIAIDGSSGNAIAVWYQPNGAYNSIYADHFTR